MSETYIRNATEHLQSSRLIHMSSGDAKSLNRLFSYPNYTTYCGFKAVNGEHCIVNGNCAVCQEVV